MARRLLAESDDVLAAAAYLLDQPWVDRARLVCAGYSFGGIMTMLGLARSGDFAAGVNFASAAMTWPHYPAIRDLLLARVEQIRDPVMIIQAENDYSTAPTPALAAALERRGVEHRAIVYPAVGEGPADGHVFCALGGRIWSPDVQAFLTQVGVLGREGNAAG
jgi:dipeptidyl aminopeptidase/acylaminoacyl peptidase